MAENFQDFLQNSNELILSRSFSCQLLKWKVSVGHIVSKGSVLAVYKKISPELSSEPEIVVLPKLKSNVGGSVKRLLVAEGEHVKPGQAVILLDVCKHKTIMKEMCAECGADLRQEPGIPGHLKEPVSASVALVHNIPELRVSQKEAEILATKDKETLLRNGKLVLLVDLDQTLIHTTTENVPPDMKDIYHFQLHGQSCWYHTKFRPGWRKFLEDMAKLYELHIFTMGSRMYAHTIARMLDPSGVLFAERIRSRDESYDMFSKYRDLRALFPCDDSMVCIIDDREDIWDCAPNLVTVKPYRFFAGTGDINAPPGSEQTFTHDSAIPLHENASDVDEKHTTDGKSRDDGCNGEAQKKKVEAANTGNSSEVSEKTENNGNSEKDKTGYEMNHNGKLSKSEEMSEEEESNNGDTEPGKQEAAKCEINEIQDNDPQSDNSQKESGDANSQVYEKSNENDVVDGNHIEDHDDYLLYLEEILRKIHGSFYEVVAWNKQPEENGNKSAARVAPDLRYIVPELQRNVLNGTNIVFTGVIPTSCRHEDSQAWKIAKQFGASVSKDLLTQKNTADRSKRTTHVVAARPGTEKACQASRLPNVQLVNPNWLWTCAERWEWVDERLFPVEGYHEYKARRNDTPTSSRRGTPKRQPENEVSRKGDEVNPPDLEESLEHMTDDNLRIVLNPFLSFSRGEMEAMDKEVEDLMRSSDEEDGEDQVDGDEKHDQIVGSVSSSSYSTENGTGDESFSKIPREQDSPDGGREDASKGQTITFSTIRQNQSRHDDDGSPSKRRKLDFVGDSQLGDEVREGCSNDEGSEGEFSDDEVSSGSNSGDEDGNDMAAMLEAALYRS